jgi:hypothetical protein
MLKPIADKNMSKKAFSKIVLELFCQLENVYKFSKISSKSLYPIQHTVVGLYSRPFSFKGTYNGTGSNLLCYIFTFTG